MSRDSRLRPLLVAEGRFTTGIGGMAMLAAFLGPLFGTGLLVEAALNGSLPWLARSPLSDLAKGATPLLIAPVCLVASFAAAWITGAWFERRLGRVEVSEAGLRFRVLVNDSADVLPWKLFEGYRDTPHPWIEVVTRKGAVRTIPVRAEADRDRLLEVLARFLPNLGLPADERQPPEIKA